MVDQQLVQSIASGLREVERRIAAACVRAGRDRQEVTLVAVTKTRTAEEVLAAYHCGLRDFGENRVEEAESKIPLLTPRFSSGPVAWHIIGHIQSRKAKKAVALGDMIHSLDSLDLATRLDRLAGESGKQLCVLVEMNVSGEASKYGLPAWDSTTLASALDAIAAMASLPHLAVQGLMTMAPLVADPEQTRPVFRRLREIRELCRPRLASVALPHLSMGMTDDLEVAIEEGATMVRVGRAIFGPAVYEQEKMH